VKNFPSNARAKDLSLAGGSTSIEQERILRDIYKAISFHPDQVPHYMFLGKLYRQALDITSAIFCFRFVLNIQPSNLQARKQLSELLIVRGQEYNYSMCVCVCVCVCVCQSYAPMR
jgi:tetratricopeptide (TPR) repeat protein